MSCCSPTQSSSPSLLTPSLMPAKALRCWSPCPARTEGRWTNWSGRRSLPEVALTTNPRTTGSCTGMAFKTLMAMFGRCFTWTPATSRRVDMNAARQIDRQIAGLTDWRGQIMGRLRKVINDADPKLKEEFKWHTAVWSANGNVCALGAFKDHIKINFFKGASLPDPHGLFNGGLEAKTSRSIDLHEGDAINISHLKALVRAAVAGNAAAK